VDEWLYALGGTPRRPQGLIDYVKDSVWRGAEVPEMRAWLKLYDLAVGLRTTLLAMQAGAAPVVACEACQNVNGCGDCGGLRGSFEEVAA
jgi:hypothetical protein